MDSNFCISVILPCYNVAEYIDRCLYSVVNQSIGLEKLEIICVNDASTDDTLDKLYDWEKKYPNNILVITYEENQRQGTARNIGMRYASAEYITFVDSDDWIERDMLQDMYQRMTSSDYDMVACKYVRDEGEGIPIACEQKDQEYIFHDISGYCWGEVENAGVNGEYGGSVTKLFKREWLIERGLWFPEGLSYEDNYWMGILILYLRKIYIIDKVYYHYWVNPNSTVTSMNSMRHLDRIEIEEMLIDKYIELGVFDVYHNEIFSNFITRYYVNTMHLLFTRFNDDNMTWGIYERIRDFIFRYYPDEVEQLASVISVEKLRVLIKFLVENKTADAKRLLELKHEYCDC